ncbi:hypothetical protein I350_01671 [Cryptococcus amylolentus CBS 6273]|uniref:Mitochondrial K+-H+ exchange-related-domain-containing protein n=1 Tax=Cryptococcus amylolentus CBS 6273 TaxID=1296118 RepID=A0A1E3KD95_9TREE|nr:hypothetical protein I350_01671 [Cryptococcus amylolentus CBS 6273]
MPPKLPLPSRPFRILALPLARLPRQPHPPPSTTTPHPALESLPATPGEQPPSPLVLFHTIQPDPPADSTPSLVNKALSKSSETWLKLGAKPKDSWMFWFYEKGEKLMDRIEFEEWALKAIREGEGIKVEKDGSIKPEERKVVELLYPKLETPLPPLIPKLHRHLLKRIPYHKKHMTRALVLSPLTWPFAIIPVIPNFPLFYVLWRAWSHYKAWQGATYLENLVKAGLVVEKESAQLTGVYSGEGRRIEGGEAVSAGEKGGAVDVTSTPEEMISTSSTTEAEPEETIAHGNLGQPLPPPAPGPLSSPASHPSLLILPSQIQHLTEAFDLRANEVVDVTRAVEQADHRARAGDAEREKVEKKE